VQREIKKGGNAKMFGGGVTVPVGESDYGDVVVKK
jgi:hypothetical protein